MHKERLNRDFGQEKLGDAAYATEGLVAKIGAALLCSELGITPESVLSSKPPALMQLHRTLL